MNTIDDVKLIPFSELGDERGHLVVVEGNDSVPFDIKRIFYIYGTKNDVARGQHANRKTEFVLVNVSGSVKVRVVDTKGNSREYFLDTPHIGLYIPPMVWKDMFEFSSDSMLLCVASEHYDSSEYIRDFDEFLACQEEVSGS